MKRNRLKITMESRIHGDVYVRFGGERLETYRPKGRQGALRLACGTGKTLIMCVAAFEMKRLGLANKPMIIGLKSNVHDIADTFRRAYPNARVLYPGREDFTPEKRVGIFHDIKNNNWDCIILTHDQFGKIPQSPEIQQEIYTQEIESIEENLVVFEQQGNEVTGWIKKGLERRKENLEAKLEKLEQDIKDRTDDVTDFRQMGIDHLFVDESQFQEPDVQHTPCESFRPGQSRGKHEGHEHAFRHPYHPGAYGQGFGGHFPLRHDHLQQPDRTLSPFQISPSEGNGAAGDYLL